MPADLKNEERFKTIPLIILTGNPGLENKLRTLGADGYFVKPVMPDDLNDILIEIKNRWLS